jgi:hypothetical protein
MQILHTDKRLNIAESGKDRPVLSSERALHMNKPATVQQ